MWIAHIVRVMMGDKSRDSQINLSALTRPCSPVFSLNSLNRLPVYH